MNSNVSKSKIHAIFKDTSSFEFYRVYRKMSLYIKVLEKPFDFIFNTTPKARKPDYEISGSHLLNVHGNLYN